MRHFYRFYYLLRDAGQGLARHGASSVATFLLLSVAVFGLNAALLAEGLLSGVARQLEAQSKMRVFLVTGSDLLAAASQVASLAGVERVTPETPEQALERFRSGFPGAASFLESFDTNPFPAALLIDVTPEADPAELAGQLAELPWVSEVIWPQEYLPRLLELAKTFRRLGTLGVAGLMGIAFLVTMLAIQLNIFSRRDEIIIRLLVGASPWSVRMQFTCEAMILGVLGGLAGGWGAQQAALSLWDDLARSLPALMMVPVETARSLPIFTAGIAAGVLLALSAGIVATWQPGRQWSDAA